MQKRDRTPDVVEADDGEKARKVQEDPLVIAAAYEFSQAEPGEAVELPMDSPLFW